MNKREQQQFAAFLEQIYETEQLLDFIKLQLWQSQGYSPQLLFELIAQGQSAISIPRLRQYLADKAACNQRELYEIFERFDWSRQGAISNADFLNELTPFGREGEAVGGAGGTVTAEAEGHLISLFLEVIKRSRVLDVARKQVRYIQPYDAFAHIDNLRTGSIGVCQLRRFFFQNDFNVTDRQLYYLLHGLRRRCYRDVNLEVFCQNLNPLQFGQYAAYAARVQQQKEQQHLQRSQYQQQTMKRSRLQAQRIEHQFQKGERRKQAELQRHLQLQQRVGAQVLKHGQQNARQVRRALLQEQRDIRYGVAAGGESVLMREQRLLAEDSLQNQYLNSIRIREEQANALLADSALQREHELERSRRTVERERELLYREEAERERALVRSAAVARQLEISRRRIEEESRRRYEDTLAEESARRVAESRSYEAEALRRRDDEGRRRYEADLLRRKEEERAYEQVLEASKKKLEESRRQVGESNRLEELRRRAFQESGRERIHHELELERQRAREEIAVLRANRVPQYEKELERTRYDVARSRGEMSASRR